MSAQVSVSDVSVDKGFTWAEKCLALGGEWAAKMAHDYYDSEFEIFNRDGRFDLVVNKGMSYPFPVTHHASTQKYAFWRTWQHIRDNKANVIMLRYVTFGRFRAIQDGTEFNVDAGHFSFCKTNAPFRWECLSNGQTANEYYSIMLPADLVQQYFPGGIPMNSSLSVGEGQRMAMSTLFPLLHRQGDEIAPSVVMTLVDALLKEAGEIASMQGVLSEPRKGVCDQRADEVISYIRLHLSNPDLSAQTVARGCDVSPRYLCYLLRLKGTSYSEVLWGERLEKAAEWLRDPNSKHYTVGEIGYNNGFKTAAHFSRLFKSKYGCSPKEYRSRNVPVSPEGNSARYAIGT